MLISGWSGIYSRFCRTEATSSSPAEEDIREWCEREKESSESTACNQSNFRRNMGIVQGESHSGVGLPKVDRRLFETWFFGDR